MPGTPDLVFGRRKKVIFVHGCFWHRHENCRLARLPKSRLEYWEPKLQANCVRDERAQYELTNKDWNVLVIWECEIAQDSRLRRRIREFLEVTAP